MAAASEHCPNPSGHYRTIFLPFDEKEWGRVLSAAYEKGFRLVRVVQASRRASTLAAIVEHVHPT